MIHTTQGRGTALMSEESEWMENHHLTVLGGHLLRKTTSSPTSQNVLDKAKGENFQWHSRVSTDLLKTRSCAQFIFGNLVTNDLK